MFNARFDRLVAVLALLAAFGSANAQFEARDLNGDGTADAYYDTQQNLSWLADANLWATLGNPVGTDGWGQPMQPGQMSFVDAVNWVAGLSIHGVSDWRLPDRLVPAGDESSPYCNATACSSWHPTAPSELSFLATALGGTSGPFQNVQNGHYMTSFSYDTGGGGGSAVLEMNHVLGGTRFLTDETSFAFGYVWAVRGGDVAQVTPVPEPSTYALMLAGLAALGFAAKRRRVPG